jgi:hypothetical protein
MHAHSIVAGNRGGPYLWTRVRQWRHVTPQHCRCPGAGQPAEDAQRIQPQPGAVWGGVLGQAAQSAQRWRRHRRPHGPQLRAVGAGPHPRLYCFVIGGAAQGVCRLVGGCQEGGTPLLGGSGAVLDDMKWQCGHSNRRHEHLDGARACASRGSPQCEICQIDQTSQAYPDRMTCRRAPSCWQPMYASPCGWCSGSPRASHCPGALLPCIILRTPQGCPHVMHRRAGAAGVLQHGCVLHAGGSSGS